MSQLKKQSPISPSLTRHVKSVALATHMKYYLQGDIQREQQKIQRRGLLSFAAITCPFVGG
jgi:hypothetical protein